MLEIWTHNEIKVVDFSGQGRTCSSIPLDSVTFSTLSQSAHGTFVGGELLVCGNELDECYLYDDETQIWRDGPDRLEERFLPYGIDMDENTHWVVLGDVATTEIFDGESFSGSVAFPKSFRGTCVGNLGDGKAIVALGDFCTFFPYEVNLTRKRNQSLPVCRL